MRKRYVGSWMRRKGHQLVAYLCIGYTDGFFSRPELELLEWEKRRELDALVRYEHY